MTLTTNMYFHTLAIDPVAAPYIVDMLKSENKEESPFIDLFLIETVNMINATRSASGKLSLCNPDPTRSTQMYPPFFCKDLATYEPRIASVSSILIYMDVAYYLFQFASTGGIIYYMVFMMRIIRKGKKFQFVTDSIRNPPFWQCIIPFVKTKQLVNFRFWDALKLISIHIVTSVLTLSSQLVPTSWPKKNGANEIDQNFIDRLNYFYVMIVLVTINSILFGIKLLSDYNYHRLVPVVMPPTLRSKINRVIIAVFCSLICLPVIVLYLWTILPTDIELYRGYMWYISAALFTIGLAIHLYVKHTYVDTAIMRLFTIQMDEEKTKRYTTAFTAIDHLHAAAWITTQVMNIFTSIFVIVHVLQCM
jgi:hypothetical protein